MHHLLDYFRETRFDINNIELIFKKFLEEKAVVEFSDRNGNIINFHNELNYIFQKLRDNNQELIRDLKGFYSNVIEREDENNQSDI